MTIVDDLNNSKTHPSPAWREKADFLFHAEVPAGDQPPRFEQLWGRRVSATTFEVCCIPFYIYDLSLGDIVQMRVLEGEKYIFDSVVVPSGHWTFRVLFEETNKAREPFLNNLVEMGVILEWSSVNMVAVDVASSDAVQQVADFLWKHEQDGGLVYETGKLA